MSDQKGSLTQTEYVNGSPPPKKRSCARHCKRFWWLYLIVFIIIAVLVIVLVIFVAVPKIAQKKVNEAKLDIQAVRVLETESNSYLMEIDSTIRTKGGIKAQVDPFEGVMYLEDYPPHIPFAKLQFPKTNNNKNQVVNISQKVEITDLAEFTRFNVWFHNNETLRITIKGKTKVKPNGLSRKSSVNFKKTLNVHGINKFDGTEVLDGQISIKKDENGRNFNGTAKIPNASVFTLDIGNVTFNNYVGDEFVGNLFIQDLLLKPGDNVVNITATMDQVAILTKVQEPAYCKSGIVPFKLLGENVTNHGQNLSYFATALGSANQTVDINIKSIIEKSLKTKLKCSE